MGPDGRHDITLAVTGGTYTSKLAAGANVVIRVENAAAASVLIKTVQSVLVTAVSKTDAKVKDAVKAVVTVAR